MLVMRAKLDGGGARLQKALQALDSSQLNIAVAEGLNLGANYVSKQMRAEIQSVFDQPTRYVVNAPWVHRATPESLQAWVAPTYEGRRKTGRDIDPQKILRAQEMGGRRHDKRVEVALRKMGILPNGMQISIPSSQYGGPLPGSTDANGNLSGPWLRKLMAYLQTSWSDVQSGKSRRQRNAVLKRYEWSTNMKSRRTSKLMDGMEFFVLKGKGPGMPGAGIWARGDKDLRLAVAFVKEVEYRNPKLSLDAIRRKADVDQVTAKWLRGRIYEAAKRAAAR